MLTSVCKATVAAVIALASAVFVAAPASAGPTDNPCDLAVSFFCQFVPIAPHLEGNVDLTQQLPPADPAAPPPESLLPALPCSNGCI